MKPTDAPEGEKLPADLAQLEQLASAADAELTASSTPPGEAGPAAPEPTQAEQILGLLTVAVMTLTPLLPFLPQCYPPATLQAIGGAAAAVCEKHGWNVGDAMTPELALAAVAIPPTIAAVMLGRQHFAEKRAAAEASSSSSSSSSQQAPLQPAANDDTRPQAGLRLL